MARDVIIDLDIDDVVLGGTGSGHPDDDVESVTGTAVDNSDPRNPVINVVGGGHLDDDVESVTGTAVDNTDPRNPVINVVGGGHADDDVETVTGTAVNNADPRNPVIDVDPQPAANLISIEALSLVAHTDDDVESVTGTAVDNTDPRNPIINLGGGGSQTLQQVIDHSWSEDGELYVDTYSVELGDDNGTFYMTAKANKDIITGNGASGLRHRGGLDQIGVFSSQGFKGLVYESDIIANLVDMSVPPKKYVDDLVDGKQDTLVSGTNIKTINNESLLGSGNITVGGVGGVTDHGALTGLGDDDHTQYALADGSRGAYYDATAIQAQVDAIDALVDQDVTNGAAPVLSAENFTNLPPSGNNNVTNNYNTQKIDTSIAVGNYGTLGGATDGVNTNFTVSGSVYARGTLEVFLNGKQVFDFNETIPASGTFSLTDAPLSTDWLLAKYLTVETSADTLFDPSKVYFQTMQQLKDAYALYGSSVVYSPIGMIDAGAVEMEVNSANLIIVGNSYFVSGIYSTEDNYTMFKNESGQFASNIDVRQCSFWADGVGSKLFDLDGTGNGGAIEFSSCNIGDFTGATTEIGTLTGFRQFKTNNCGFFRTNGSLKFGGTWSGGFRITETIVLAQGANTTLFEPVAGLTFGGRCISDINAASVDPTTITLDFIPANFILDGGFQLTGASFAPVSSISVTTDETSIKSFFRDCIEIRNTRPGFEMAWTTNTNTPLTLNTPTKALGTTVTSNPTWFAQTGNNEVTYLSSLTKDLKVDLDISVDGGANDEITVHLMLWDDSASSYVVVKSKTRNISNVLGGLDVALFSFSARVDDVGLNDRLEVFIENISDSTDAIVQSGSEIYVEVL